MFKTHGLTHLQLAVSDLERSKTFYCEGLGMTVSFTVTFTTAA